MTPPISQAQRKSIQNELLGVSAFGELGGVLTRIWKRAVGPSLAGAWTWAANARSGSPLTMVQSVPDAEKRDSPLPDAVVERWMAEIDRPVWKREAELSAFLDAAGWTGVIPKPRQGGMIYPLRAGGRPQGLALLIVGPAGMRRAKEIESRLAALLTLAPFALEKCALLERSSSLLARTRQTLRLFSDLGAGCPIHVALERIAQVTEAQFGAERVVIALQTPDGSGMTVAASRGAASGDPSAVPMVGREVWESLAAILSRGDAILGPVEASFWPPPLTSGDASAEAVVLLLRRDRRVIGLLAAERASGAARGPWPEREILDVFAEQASQAIDNARLYTEVERLAETDGLTGIFNRHYFDRVLEREIPRVKRYGDPLSLLLIDVCEFKTINDTYGHLAGDEILKSVASLLAANVRESDIVARFGGDEFVVLMPSTGEAQARLAVERIEKAMERNNQLAIRRDRRFILSIGLKTAVEANVDQILDQADRAMYQEKELYVRRRLLEAILADDDRDLEALDKTLASNLRILRQKEPQYSEHARRVMRIAIAISQRMGLDKDAVEIVALGALLHDLGKVVIQGALLMKPRRLTRPEYEIVKTHATIGDNMLSAVERFRPVKSIVRWHHERFDGSVEGPYPGYPDGLCGTQIPLGARIVKVADAFDAMTCDRPYRRAIPAEDAEREVLAERGLAFDPEVVDSFLACRESGLAISARSAAGGLRTG